MVQTHIRAASEMVGRSAALHFLENTDGWIRNTRTSPVESPLELLFWIWWQACERPRNFFPYDLILLEPQVAVTAGGEDYRLDFVVVLLPPSDWKKALDAGLMVWPKIAVELDGHTFHERTPQQVATRDSRDRHLQQDGWQVFHYSWSEFTNQPEKCVTEVYDLATTIVDDLYRQYSLDIPAEFKGE